MIRQLFLGTVYIMFCTVKFNLIKSYQSFQKVASPAAAATGTSPEQNKQKIAVSMAAHKAVEASPAAIDAPERGSKKMATQKAVETSLALVNAGTPIEKIHEKGRIPMVVLMLFKSKMQPIKVYTKVAVPIAAKKVVRASPAVLDASPLIMRIRKRQKALGLPRK